MLLGTLGASLLGHILVGKGIVRAGSGKGIVRTGSENTKRERNCESWLWKRNGFLMPAHPSPKFEIQEYY